MLLLVGGFALYARQELFNANAFSQTAAKSLQDEAVRDALAEPIVEQIINIGPDQLINAQPLLQGAVSGALETNAFKSVFRDAVRKAHKALFRKDRDELVLTIQEVNGVIVTAVGSVSPATAKKIPEDVGQRLVRITESKTALTLARWSREISFLGLLLPPLGILALAGAVFTNPDRRRALVNVFIGIGAAAAVGFIGLLAARTLLLRRFDDETTHDAVAALFDNYMDGLADWLLLGGVVAVALAAAAAARDPDPLDRPRQAAAWIARTPERTWTRVARALVIGIAGVIAFLEPALALQIFAVIVGAIAIYYAVVELIAAIAPPPAPAGGRSRAAKAKAGVPPAPNWRVPALAAATIVAAAVGVAFLITQENKRAAARPAGPVKNCNGHPQLCDRALDEVAFPATHNAMSAAELPAWFTPNQRRGIPRQLKDGVRALLIDTHYGIKRPSGPMLTDLDQEGTSKVLETVNQQLGPEGARQFKQLSARFASSGGKGEPGSYLCHVVCELGATKLTKALGWVKDFLDTHPDEVVILFIEDAISPEATAEAFEESGILRYAYAHRPGRPFPTLREMIERDRRLFVMAEKDNGGGEFAWYHDGFDLAQETPYTFKSPAELSDLSTSCVPNRGDGNNPLFQLNHWVEKIPRSPDIGAKVNAFDFLKRRARECDRRRGLLSNLVAVDFYNEGDLLEVTRVLNGIPRNKKPSYRETG